MDGPIAAELMFYAEDCDAFVVILQDQGHIPSKLPVKQRTVGLPIGSPILFSSVEHGSAHDIAGNGIAEPTAMIEAIRRLVG